MATKYWLNNPRVLVESINFIPTSTMSRIEQLNALAQFSLIYIIVLTLFKKPQNYFIIPIILLVFNVIFYYSYKSDPDRIRKISNKNIKLDDLPSFESVDSPFKTEIVESGTINSDNKIKLGEKYTAKSKPVSLFKTTESKFIEVPNRDTRILEGRDIIDYSANELLEYEKKTCRIPIKENPFMNPPVTDFNTEFNPSACNVDDEDIKTNIETNFNDNLYRDMSDLWDVKNSQRIWYTIPTPSVPPDQPGFANWLYNTEGPCKTNQYMCLRYEDLRYKS